MDKRGAATDILLMTTRGGNKFDREFTQSFIRPGLSKDGWANRANYSAIGIHQTGDTEMSLFLTGGRRYTLRLDGFVSVNALLTGGEFISKPLRFTGGRLEINYSTSAAGQVRVELQDAAGKPLPGFALDDCEPIWGDHIARIVKWKGGDNVSAYAGKPVRLRFELSDADLFSLRFTDKMMPCMKIAFHFITAVLLVPLTATVLGRTYSHPGRATQERLRDPSCRRCPGDGEDCRTGTATRNPAVHGRHADHHERRRDDSGHPHRVGRQAAARRLRDSD